MRTFIICEKCDTDDCDPDKCFEGMKHIIEDQGDTLCFPSEADLLRIYDEIKELRGEGPRAIIRHVRKLLDIMEEKVNGSS